MKVLEWIKELFDKHSHLNNIKWKIDKINIAEGINFVLPPEANDSLENYILNNSLFAAQYVYLKDLYDRELATKIPNGFTVNSETIASLSDDFAQLFDFPPLFKGQYEANIHNKISQASFRVNYILIMEDGQKIFQYELTGPFLKISDNEIYRLNLADWQALYALHCHQNLPLSQYNEYENAQLVYQLQLARKNGMPVDLRHFDNNDIEVLKPNSIGVAMQTLPDGSLELIPNIRNIDIEEVRQRTGQLSQNNTCLLRVNKKIVLFEPKQLEAMQEILSKKQIPKEQVTHFIASPSAYLDASLIDLDLGFSLRAYGAEKFSHFYAGEVEKSNIDWFYQQGKIESVKVLNNIIKDIAQLNDIENDITKTYEANAQILKVENREIDISDREEVEETLNKLKNKFSFDSQLDNQEKQEENHKKETIVIDIEKNDDEMGFSDYEHRHNLNIQQQRFERDNLKRTPYLHQEEGIHWLLVHIENSKGALLADDMGLGKTYMTLVAIHEQYCRCEKQDKTKKPILIVAPLSLLENWRDEVDKTFIKSPFKDVIVLQAEADLKRFKAHNQKETKAILEEDNNVDLEKLTYSLKIGNGYSINRLDMPSRLVLTTYQTLRDYQFSLALVDWGMVIFDEAQNLKNPNTLATRAAKGLKADFKLLATGTPVENSLKDFWCLMDTATPGLLGAWQDFREQYIQPIISAKNEDVFAKKIEIGKRLRHKVGNFMLRRTKEENLKGLPNKIIYTGDEQDQDKHFLPILAAEMKTQQLYAYNEIIEKVNQCDIEDKRKLILSSLRELKVTSIHHQLNINDKNIVNNAFTSVKIKTLLSILDLIREKKEKAIIFVETKIIQSYLTALIAQKYKIIVEIINGETQAVSKKANKKTRKSIIDNFQEKEGFNILIMSPIAAGVGLTVVGANNVIHLERHWNPAKEAQATDRVYRIGQTKTVNVYLPMALHPNAISFDLQLNRLLNKKVDLSNAIVESSNDTNLYEEFSSLFAK
ncbi:DEAD/DEAH box helicase [Volucribacter amazonae]|uniref:SNF2 family DNA or RNA helicase n=1 Tax=Volucribacter amazonae TaxID=256731 RepID=A0A9X4PDT5_9PAST|nr:DEAD/DEAH box helicase [Volucribacter amazonae]MDG6895414.1 hypothetical protein [Volucribacter amazonae]